MRRFWPGAGPKRPSRFQSTTGGTLTITPRTQTAKARIQASTSQTQTAKANIGTPVAQTQTAKARISTTTSHTQPAVARITATTNQTTTALARIQVSTSKTQTAKGRVKATTTKTQTSLGRITATTSQTQTAKANIGTPNLAVRAAASPALAATYGTFALNATNGILIVTEPRSLQASEFGDWSCTLRVSVQPGESSGNDAQDDALFNQRIQAVETNLRIPRQALVVRMGSETIRNWTFTQASQTAFLIQPQLDLVSTSRRDFRYTFTVRCQFPGNIPNNAYRRESTTSLGDSLRERRTCEISATWTSSAGYTALANYTANGDAFFNAYLPANSTSQYNETGVWVLAETAPVTTNDENSLCTARRVYWECFSGGRRESSAKTIDTIQGRKTWTGSCVFVKTNSATALQNYLDNGDAHFARILPALTGDSSWVLVDEEPQYNDQNGILTVVRTYQETVRGLRDYTVNVTTLANQTRQIVIDGVYYQTGATSALVNYQNDIDRLRTEVLTAYNVTRYESRAIPKVERYDAANKRYFFTHTILELAYPQGNAVDDANVTLSSLEIDGDIPYDYQSIPNGITINRLQKVVARFVATVDYTRNQDPAALWRNGLRSYVLNAVATKLGSTTITLDLLDEQIGVGLTGNTLRGTLYLLVTGGSVLSLRLTQQIIQVPGRDFAARADGTQFSAFPYYDVAEKILIRAYTMEYVVGAIAAPDPFSGTSSVSGLALIDTGMTAQQSIDAQNTPGAMSGAPGWFIDRRAPMPYSFTETPMTRGVSFKTVLRQVVETWRYIATLQAGV